jgi:hypothetical protein
MYVNGANSEVSVVQLPSGAGERHVHWDSAAMIGKAPPMRLMPKKAISYFRTNVFNVCEKMKDKGEDFFNVVTFVQNFFNQKNLAYSYLKRLAENENGDTNFLYENRDANSLYQSGEEVCAILIMAMIIKKDDLVKYFAEQIKSHDKGWWYNCDIFGCSPAVLAVLLGRLDCLQLFIENDADVNDADEEDEDACTLLRLAVEMEDVAIVKFLLQQPEVMFDTNDGTPPDENEEVKALLEKYGESSEKYSEEEKSKR